MNNCGGEFEEQNSESCCCVIQLNEVEEIQKRLKESLLLLEKEESHKSKKDNEEKELGDQQQAYLEEIEQDYISKIEDLTRLCSKANQRIKEDTKRIESLEKTIHEQKNTLKLCDQFVSSYRKREQKLVNLVNGIDSYFENKMKRKEQQVGCFHLPSKKSSTDEAKSFYRDMVKEMQALLVSEDTSIKPASR